MEISITSHNLPQQIHLHPSATGNIDVKFNILLHTLKGNFMDLTIKS